jgi:hypothetical protein
VHDRDKTLELIIYQKLKRERQMEEKKSYDNSSEVKQFKMEAGIVKITILTKLFRQTIK